MKGFALLRRWRRGFRESRHAFLQRAGRRQELAECPGGPFIAIDLGFGPELWRPTRNDIVVEPEWFTLGDATLVILDGDSYRAIVEAERRGQTVTHQHIKF